MSFCRQYGKDKELESVCNTISSQRTNQVTFFVHLNVDMNMLCVLWKNSLARQV